MDGAHADTWDAGSSVQRAAVDRLRHHTESEKEIIEAYARLAATGPDDFVRYLARLIVEDEQRHHALLAEMLNTLQAQVRWERAPRASVPEVPHSGTSVTLRGEIQQLLAAEKADAASLRQLRRDLRKLRDTSLLALIVELMELDTAKHVRILEFIRAATRSGRRTDGGR